VPEFLCNIFTQHGNLFKHNTMCAIFPKHWTNLTAHSWELARTCSTYLTFTITYTIFM